MPAVKASEQAWIDVLFNFGMDRYKTEVEAYIFSIRGVQVLRNWRYAGLNADAVLTEILDWVGEYENPETIVPEFRRLVETEGFITPDGGLLRP